MFLDSVFFKAHEEYIRNHIVHGLLQACKVSLPTSGNANDLQEDAATTLHLITSILYFDGRQNDGTFELMNREGAFPRLVELIGRQADDDDGLLHRRLLELLYEMSRIQKIAVDDLSQFAIPAPNARHED